MRKINPGYLHQFCSLICLNGTVLKQLCTEAVNSINYIGRQLDVSYIGRQMYGEISIRYEFSMRHLAANISSPKVRELHDHFLWRKRVLKFQIKLHQQTLSWDVQYTFVKWYGFKIFKYIWFINLSQVFPSFQHFN